MRLEAKLVMAFGVITIARIVIATITSSFWIDETGTLWVIAAGAAETFHRAATFPQSILYCLIVFITTQIGGLREFVLRIPSVAASIGTLAVVNSLTARMFDRQTAPYAWVAFLCIEGVAFSITDARPYAFAMLAISLSMLGFWEFLATAKRAPMAAWIIFAALSVYFSLFFIFAVVAQAAYVRYRSGFAGFLRVLPKFLLIEVLLLPLATQFLNTFRQRAFHALTVPNPISRFREVTLPSSLLFVIAVFVISYLISRPRPLRISATRDALVLVILWALIPPILLLACTELTSAKVMTYRYAMPAAPAMAMGLAAMLRNTPVTAARITAIAMLCGVTMTGRGLGLHLFGFHQHDWRTAIQIANTHTAPDMPVLVAPWFVEALTIEYPVSSETHPIRAPLLAYPIQRSEVIMVPYEVNDRNRAFVDSVIARLKQTRRFILITYPDVPIVDALQAGGFRPRALYTKREPNVLLFTNVSVP